MNTSFCSLDVHKTWQLSSSNHYLGFIKVPQCAHPSFFIFNVFFVVFGIAVIFWKHSKFFKISTQAFTIRFQLGRLICFVMADGGQLTASQWTCMFLHQNIKPPFKPQHMCVAEQEWPETLCNNELFDLNRISSVIIFLSEAYQHTWLLWLQTWSALSVFLTRRGRKIHFYCDCVSFCCPTRVSSAVIQVDWWDEEFKMLINHADNPADGFIYYAPVRLNGKWKPQLPLIKLRDNKSTSEKWNMSANVEMHSAFSLLLN